MPKVKNIIFDLGGVLLDIDYNLTRQSFESLGVKNFIQLYSQSNANHLFQNLEKGTIDAPEFFKEFNRCTGLSLSVKEISQAWNAMLLDFRESSLQYIETLKNKAQLILLSNTNIIHTEALRKIFYKVARKFPFDQYFQHCIYSYETGTRKPDADCYLWALDKANIRPEETIFIDDSPQNIKGALSVGITGILLEKNKKIEELGLEQWL